MRARERPAYWLGPGPAPEIVAFRLARLAGRLAARSEPDEHMLLETVVSGRSPIRLLGVPAGLEGGLELLAAVPGPAPRPPGSSGPGRFVLLGDVARREDGARRPSGREAGEERDRRREPDPPCPLPLPASVWAALQVHWAPTGDGKLGVALRAWVVPSGDPSEAERAAGLLSDRTQEIWGSHRATTVPARRGARREWERGAWRKLLPERRFRAGPEAAARLALLAGLAPPPAPDPGPGHTVVFGASGSGKSAYLVDRLRERIVRGEPSAVFDVHGDLGPRLLAALRGEGAAHDRLVAIDPSAPGRPPGLRLLGSHPSVRDAERAHLLAALRRAGSEEGSTFWGARLDRTFDTFARAVQETGGGLRDLYELLVDPDRRDAVRARTAVPEVASFLEELPAILRRNPEFLWPAAARLHRLVLAPHLAALVDAPDDPLDVDGILGAGRTLLWRLPVGELGPEGSQLLVTLLASRIYLSRVSARAAPGHAGGSVLMVLDEAHLVAPRLLAEMVTEGRKFGVAVLAATQSPERLEESARVAVEASVGHHLVFRVPRAHVAGLAPYLGWNRGEAARVLPHLPSGSGFEIANGPGGRCLPRHLPDGPPADDAAWRRAVERTLDEMGPEAGPGAPEMAPAEEGILLALLAGEATRGRASAHDLAAAPGVVPPLDELALRLPALLARGWIEGGPATGWALTPLGRARLGFRAATGATRESAEHRALLLEAFRIFARNGCRIEILRQGRFDTRLPDARFRAIDPAARAAPGPELRAAIERARGSWSWRLFGGRDVHLEAEVSGAERPERIRHGLRKGRAAGAFTLFLVSDAERARRIRRVLASGGGRAGDAGVWVLRRAAPNPPREGGL